MRGERGNHPKFGEQFKIVFCQNTTPANSPWNRKIPGNRASPMAKRIVKRFKEDTLNVIEKEINRLAEVEGIGKKEWDSEINGLTPRAGCNQGQPFDGFFAPLLEKRIPVPPPLNSRKETRRPETGIPCPIRR